MQSLQVYGQDACTYAHALADLLFTLIITIYFDNLATPYKKSVGGIVFRCTR
jgi:hypothetical protein